MPENSSTFNFKPWLSLAGLLLFLLLLVPPVIYFGNLYEEANQKNKINAYNQKRFREFYETPRDTLDLVFFGSSHSYCTFDPEVFDNRLGTKSYQIGMPLQHPDATYFTMLEVLRYQSPKTVVVEVYWDMLDDDFDLKQSDSLFEVLENDQMWEEYYKTVFPLNEKVKYNIKPIRYQSDYLAYQSSELGKCLEETYQVKKETYKDVGQEYYRSQGYVVCDYNIPPDKYDKTNQFRNFDGKNWSFSKTQKAYLQKIIDLTKQENMHLYFVTAPIANVSMEKIKNYELVHEQIAAFAEENQVPYIDYNLINRYDKLLTNVHFRDDAHLNHEGVLIVSGHFAEVLFQAREIASFD